MSISHEQAGPRVKLTYDDYVLFPNDGNRHEIINGRHYMNASPTPRHQLISGELFLQLSGALRSSGHKVFTAPIDVQLSESDVVVPDLVVVLAGNDIITETRIIGVPDLVIEILSPSTSKNDKHLKLHLYEQAGIPEYWIVDPDQNSVTAYRLVNDAYQEAPVQNESISFASTEVSLTVDLSRIW